MESPRKPAKRAKLDRKEDIPSKEQFPPAFLAFLEENGIDLKVYELLDKLPRYIRIHPNHVVTEAELSTLFKTPVSPVSWMKDFYQLDGKVKIADSSLYREGKLYGIDLSSGVAVIALGVEPGDHVLDLCCAPGAKLCFLSNLLGDTGSVTGVDVASPRLAACRTMVTKYKLANVRLFLDDGTSFDVGAPENGR
eukprot:TRINITY_DN7972_c0_g1_i1.p1 TRINITY_DN7972_c0_g1~~TRINITY_DN7972_c0_g1_i1.p1  ORF type:complete len:194 (+),score=19.35 TRINITY_DN7972_c0_g1_i1:26-607(+)